MYINRWLSKKAHPNNHKFKEIKYFKTFTLKMPTQNRTFWFIFTLSPKTVSQSFDMTRIYLQQTH